MRLLTFIFTLFTLFSCWSEKDNIINEYALENEYIQIKDYEINDSVSYKIMETKNTNLWKRDLIVYNNKVEINRYNILEKKRKTLHADWYIQTKEINYTELNDTLFFIQNLTIHNENFKVIDIDTTSDTLHITGAL